MAALDAYASVEGLVISGLNQRHLAPLALGLVSWTSDPTSPIGRGAAFQYITKPNL